MTRNAHPFSFASSLTTSLLVSLITINWVGVHIVDAWSPSSDAYNLIKEFEGLKLSAYRDPVGIWTIGYGTIQYPNGRKVRSGDRISQADAFRYLQFEVDEKARGVESVIGGGVYLYQNQFDALVSFTYNLGIGALRRSTLLQKVKRNPNDVSIRQEFGRWVYGGGRVLPGLVRRRNAEANLYFAHM